MNLILLGAPGTGKGTLAAGIRNAVGIAHVSTGDMFRQNIKDGTPLGKEASGYISRGELVPDALTIRMLEERLQRDDCRKGFLLDGYPRTIAQADALSSFLTGMGQKIDAVLNVRLADETIQERLSGRRVCPSCGCSYNLSARPPKKAGICDACGATLEHRNDDRPETIAVRLRSYHDKTRPLEEYYAAHGLLHEYDNEVGSDVTLKSILSALESLERAKRG
jgi:adenylate kinase